jgi:hypothetical protein
VPLQRTGDPERLADPLRALVERIELLRGIVLLGDVLGVGEVGEDAGHLDGVAALREPADRLGQLGEGEPLAPQARVQVDVAPQPHSGRPERRDESSLPRIGEGDVDLRLRQLDRFLPSIAPRTSTCRRGAFARASISRTASASRASITYRESQAACACGSTSANPWP